MSGAFNDRNGDWLSIYALTKLKIPPQVTFEYTDQLLPLLMAGDSKKVIEPPDHQVNANLQFQR